MKVLSLIFGLAASGGAAAFLQPVKSQHLQPYLQHEKHNSGFLKGEIAPNSSSLHMVAIRSPFWHAFDSKEEGRSSEEFIIDRDFSVATTLMAVGIWLTCFGPSKSPHNLSPVLQLQYYSYSNTNLNHLLYGTGNYHEVDMLGGIFHIWFGAFIGKQTMKTRAVCCCWIQNSLDHLTRLLIYMLRINLDYTRLFLS